jgi:hypothetical protein
LGSGVLAIDAGGAVSAHAELGVASVVFLSGGNETLQGKPSEIGGIISGFGAGDVIDIRPVIATTLSFLAGTLTLLDGNDVVDQLYLAGNYDVADFALSADGHGGTDIKFVQESFVQGNWQETEVVHCGFVTDFLQHII